MIQAVLFDADGVLVDAGQLHFQSLNRALATKGWCISYADHENLLAGLPTKAKLQWLSDYRGLPSEWHAELLDTKQQLTIQVIDEFIKPDSSKIELLEALQKHEMAIAVCSNMHQESLEFLLERAGLRPHLDFAVGHDRVGKPKPAPDVYLAGAIGLGFDISVCSIIVDQTVSYQAAVRADPLDIVVVESGAQVNLGLLPRIMRFEPDWQVA